MNAKLFIIRASALGLFAISSGLRAQEPATGSDLPGLPSAPPVEAPPPAATAPDVPKSANPTAVTDFGGESETISVDSGPAADPGIEISQSEEDDKISINLIDVPLRDVVQMFSRISKANIVAKDQLEGRVTVSLTDVNWRDALESILEIADLAMVEKRPGIYSIINRADVASQPLIVETIILNYVTVTNVLPVVQKMLVSTNASVTVLPAANAMIITETALQITAIKSVLAQIDKPRPQVFIETKFVELNDQAIEDLGINWEVLQGYTVTAGELSRALNITRSRVNQDAVASLDGRTKSSSDIRTQTDNTGNTLNAGIRNKTSEQSNNRVKVDGTTIQDFDGILSGKNFSEVTVDNGDFQINAEPAYTRTDVRSAVLTAEQFALTLSALKATDGASIVSNPKLLVSNGEKARIHVGRNEPNIEAIPVGELGDRFAFQLDKQKPFIEIGIKLEVTPTINTEDNITLKIIPELSRLIGEKSVGEANTTFPITQIRRIETEFNVGSGRTVAIGGLTENSEKEVVKKVPVLGDIPIIGKYLFTHRHTEMLQDEVVIFVSVDMANPDKITEDSGIPETSKLVYRHLEAKRLQKAQDEAQGKSDKDIENEVDKILQSIRNESAAKPSNAVNPDTLPADESPALEPAP